MYSLMCIITDKVMESEGHEIPAKRLSSKSIQSVTSAEIEWSDDDERSPINTPRKASQSKVSFIDKDVSEIHEIVRITTNITLKSC